MITEARINEIASQAATRYLKKEAVERVTSQDSTDFEGNRAIRITIRLKRGMAKRLKDDAVLDALVAIKSDLAHAGEDRPSIVQYEEVGEVTEGDDASAKS